MDDLVGFGDLFDADGDGTLDPDETLFGLMVMDYSMTDDGEDPFADEDSELELMTGYSREELEFMDDEERAEILEDAGYEADDFGFDDF